MHTSTLLSSILVAGTALAAPTSPIFRRQQDCGYYPDQANQATSTFILRIEALSNGISNATTTNATLTNSTLPTTNGTTNSILSNSNATTTPNEILRNAAVQRRLAIGIRPVMALDAVNRRVGEHPVQDLLSHRRAEVGTTGSTALASRRTASTTVPSTAAIRAGSVFFSAQGAMLST